MDLLSNPDFQKQVVGALLMAAINVVNEEASTAHHAERLKWARQILQQPSGQAGLIFNYLLTNPTIAAAAGSAPGPSGTPVLDSDMDFVVASLFDQFAIQQAG
jgi:hypothetical protein